MKITREMVEAVLEACFGSRCSWLSLDYIMEKVADRDFAPPEPEKRKRLEYNLATVGSPQDLVAESDALLAEGWMLAGGVSVAVDSNNGHRLYAQAFTREVEL